VTHQHDTQIAVTLDLEVPQDRVFPEELELFEAHLSALIQQVLAQDNTEAA
jgi:hypothetical protein